MKLDDEMLDNYRKSRAAFLRGDIADAENWWRINRSWGLDAYYEVALPEHVKLVHPIGTVLGRATYGDYFVAYHGCGVGSDLDGNRPVIGEGVVLFPGAKVVGRVKVGNNVFITANTVVHDCDVPDNSIVVSGVYGAAVLTAVRPTMRSVRAHYFP